MRPSEARTHGAGLLLAESLVGINHGLHSRAAALLPLMLQEDILSTTDLKVYTTKSSLQRWRESVSPTSHTCCM